MIILSFDIETKSPVDLLKHGVYNYVNSQFFQILWLSYSINYGLVKRVDLTKDPIPEEFLTLLFDPNCIKRAANATFERVCFSRVLGVYLPPEQFECTLVLAGRNGLPMRLEDAALRAGVASQKAASGDHLIKMFSIPVPQAKDTPVWKQWVTPQEEPLHWENYGKYNAIDVYAEMDVCLALQDMPVPAIEHSLYGLDQRINDRGVLLDRRLASQAQRIGAIFKEEKTQEIIALTGIKNPNSVKQLVGWLNEEAEMQITTPGHLGIEGEVVKFGDVYGRIEKLPKQAVVKILADMPSAKTQQVLEARLMLGKASVAKYKKMNELVCCDSRIRGMLAFYGAHTGRWAGRGLQPQNFTKHKTKEIDLLRELIKSGDMNALAAKFPDIPDALSQAVRTAFIAKPGHEFIVSDYAAIEARVTAWLAGEWWLVDFFEKGKGDVYIETAARMFNIIAETIDKETYEGNEIRQRGKMAMLALGFGGSVGALTNMCNAYGVYIAEEEKKPIVDKFRLANPNIVKFWDMLEWAALQAMLQPGVRQYVGNNGISYLFHKGNLYCSLPSGRWMCYREARIGENRWGGAAIRYKQSKGRGAWFEVDTFGGKFCENICQATARDILAGGMLRLDHYGYDIVLHVHDEAVAEVLKATREIEEMNNIMCMKSPWYADLPLKAAGFKSAYYKKG